MVEKSTLVIGVAGAVVAGGIVAYLLRRSPPPGRKLNPFSAKMAEGVFVEKVGAPTGAISTALYFSELPSPAELQALLRDKLLSFDVFTSVFRSGRWVPVEVDLAAHVFEATVSSDAELLAYCETEMVTALRNGAGAPLWEVHTVRNTGSGRSMLFFRIEHAIGDGVALNQVLSRLATDSKGAPLPPASYTRPAKPPRSLLALLLEGLCAALKYAGSPMGRFDSDTPLVPARAERNPLRFKGRRKIVLMPEHGLSLIKRIKEAATASRRGSGAASFTVNDVIFAAAAGTLRRYCLATAPAEPLDGCLVRALSPIAFPRKPDAPLANDWCFVDVPMPCGLATMAQRLEASHAAFAAVKGGPEALVAKTFTDLNCGNPSWMFSHAAQQVKRPRHPMHPGCNPNPNPKPNPNPTPNPTQVMQRYSLVFSNVPGPTAHVHVCGKQLLGLQAFYPNLIMQGLCVSYAGTMWMNFIVDPDVVVNHETLPALYMDELRALAAHFGVDPDA